MRSTFPSLAFLLAALQQTTAAPTTTSSDVRVNSRDDGKKVYSVYATWDKNAGEYMTNVNIDGNNYNILFDTGSTDVWVKGNGTSSTPFSASYGSGSANGSVEQGTISVGTLSIPNFNYGSASSTQGFPDGEDGIIGLQPNAQELHSNDVSWLASIQNSIPDPVFFVDLQPDSSDAKSSFWFGNGTLIDAYPPMGNYSTDPNRNGWYVDVDNFNIPNPPGTQNYACVLDTGTTALVLPQETAIAYWGLVEGASTSDNSSWTYPCTSTLPDVNPVVNGQKWTIPGNMTSFNAGSGPGGSGLCQGRVLGSQSSCILGQPLFYTYFLSFDFDTKVASLASKPPNSVLSM